MMALTRESRKGVAGHKGKKGHPPKKGHPWKAWTRPGPNPRDEKKVLDTPAITVL